MKKQIRTAWIWTTLIAGVSPAQVTQRVNLSSSGAQADQAPLGLPMISADGRYVAFGSVASNLVAGDTNLAEDIFVRDRLTGTIERISIDSGGAQGNGTSRYPVLSDDGRYVAFQSVADNLVPGDTNGAFGLDVFVRDRLNGTTERVSIDSNEAQVNGGSYGPAITADGRYVAFTSLAPNLVPGDTNGAYDIFVRDRQNGTTQRIPVGLQLNGSSSLPSISDDAVVVAFTSYATLGGDTNGERDIYVGFPMGPGIYRLSDAPSGFPSNGASEVSSISMDANYAAFGSEATNLVIGDTNSAWDIFVYDLFNDVKVRVSVGPGGVQADGDSQFPSISSDGRYVAFQSLATNLVPGDTNGVADIFVRDLLSGTTQCVSIDQAGAQGNGASTFCSISADGRYVTFNSFATSLVPGDTNGLEDVFVHDRLGGTDFTSLCDPAVGGVQPCPCSNAPSGAGRGCNNSAATGGAVLSAAGGTNLSSESLVFTTTGERLTATSILLQGTTSPAAGIIYGQGVRCVGGSLKRLFTKSAVGGSITVPNFAGGDPTVSARSAAKGDLIGAGQSRWYLVFYRDPIVLGGCPASSTFNATQTGQIAWSP